MNNNPPKQNVVPIDTDTATDIGVSDIAFDEKLFPPEKRQHTFATRGFAHNNTIKEESDNHSEHSSHSDDSDDDSEDSNGHHHHEHSDETEKNVLIESGHSKEEIEKEKDPEEGLTPRQVRLKKLDLIRKIADLADEGYPVIEDYTFATDLQTLQDGYDLLYSWKSKKFTVQQANQNILNGIRILEWLNKAYNPMGLHLDGWHQAMESQSEYCESLYGEIYDMYTKPGTRFNPFIKLLLVLVGSAVQIHFTKLFTDSVAKNPSGFLSFLSGGNKSQPAKQTPPKAPARQPAPQQSSETPAPQNFMAKLFPSMTTVPPIANPQPQQQNPVQEMNQQPTLPPLPSYLREEIEDYHSKSSGKSKHSKQSLKNNIIKKAKETARKNNESTFQKLDIASSASSKSKKTHIKSTKGISIEDASVSVSEEETKKVKLVTNKKGKKKIKKTIED